jgi:hypothetical protein
MKLLNKIFVVILLPIFVFSSTGLVLIHHECESCGISEILVNKQHTHAHDNCSKEQQMPACCKGSSCEMPVKIQVQTDTECCKEEVFYFKVKEPYVNYTLQLEFDINPIQLPDFNILDGFENQMSSQILYSSINKPPDLSGRDILRHHCILRV